MRRVGDDEFGMEWKRLVGIEGDRGKEEGVDIFVGDGGVEGEGG